MIIRYWFIPFLLMIVVFTGLFISDTLFSTDTGYELTNYYYPYGNFIYKNELNFTLKKRKILFHFTAERAGLHNIGLGLNFLTKIAEDVFLFKLQNNELALNYQNSYPSDIYRGSQYLNFNFEQINNSEDRPFQVEIELPECELNCSMAKKIGRTIQAGYIHTPKQYPREAVQLLSHRLSKEVKLFNLLATIIIFLFFAGSLNLLLDEVFKVKVSYNHYLIGLAISFSFFIFLVTTQNLNSLLFNLWIIFIVATLLLKLNKHLYLPGLVIFLVGLLFFSRWNESVGNNLSFWSYIFFLSAVLIESGKKLSKLWAQN